MVSLDFRIELFADFVYPSGDPGTAAVPSNTAGVTYYCYSTWWLSFFFFSALAPWGVRDGAFSVVVPKYDWRLTWRAPFPSHFKEAQ